MTIRKRTPLPPVTAVPLTVSDQTALDLVGLTGRQLRDLLARHPEVPRTIVGRRVLVRADVLLALLDRLAVTPDPVPVVPAAPPDGAPGVAEVLAAIGRRRAG